MDARVVIFPHPESREQNRPSPPPSPQMKKADEAVVRLLLQPGGKHTFMTEHAGAARIAAMMDDPLAVEVGVPAMCVAIDMPLAELRVCFPALLRALARVFAGKSVEDTAWRRTKWWPAAVSMLAFFLGEQQPEPTRSAMRAIAFAPGTQTLETLLVVCSITGGVGEGEEAKAVRDCLRATLEVLEAEAGVRAAFVGSGGHGLRYLETMLEYDPARGFLFLGCLSRHKRESAIVGARFGLVLRVCQLLRDPAYTQRAIAVLAQAQPPRAGKGKTPLALDANLHVVANLLVGGTDPNVIASAAFALTRLLRAHDPHLGGEVEGEGEEEDDDDDETGINMCTCTCGPDSFARGLALRHGVVWKVCILLEHATSQACAVACHCVRGTPKDGEPKPEPRFDDAAYLPFVVYLANLLTCDSAIEAAFASRAGCRSLARIVAERRHPEVADTCVRTLCRVVLRHEAEDGDSEEDEIPIAEVRRAGIWGALTRVCVEGETRWDEETVFLAQSAARAVLNGMF